MNIHKKYVKILGKLIEKLKQEEKESILYAFADAENLEWIKEAEKRGEWYLSIKRLPKAIEQIPAPRMQTDTVKNEFAIVMQGLLREEDDFTLKTVLLYKKIFPEAMLIISTWENQSAKLLDRLEREGCLIVKEPDVDNCGVSNINRQIIGSKKGIEKAKSCGAQYVLRIRTDARIYYPYALEFLKSLLEVFFVSGNEWKQEKRIVTSACYPNRVQELPPYFMRDYMYFGTANDLMEFFSVPFTKKTPEDYKDYLKKKGKERLTIQEEFEMDFSPESYLTKEYIKKMTGKNVKTDYETWWEKIQKYFIMISPWDIDMYFVKHDVKYVQPASYARAYDGQLYETRNYDFKKFLILYNQHLKIPEYPFTAENEVQKYWSGY